nr:PREDICTED: spexin-like [Latimeria chalumnae]|eukprot:XP_014349644.1 PREDICTED: spexin-like [Latimeria chalumnae]
MKPKTAVICTCAIFMISLAVETLCATKGKVLARNWGPQSMLYLKGRYGRSHAADNKDEFYKLELDDWNILLKNYKRIRPVEFRNFRRRLTSENVEVQYMK